MDPTGWSGIAYNQATESENPIHADEVARRHGFRGGLVPGVTVYAYLVQPALVAWGREWLEQGHASITLSSPLYDGEPFEVAVEQGGPRVFEGRVTNAEGTACATGSVGLDGGSQDHPTRRGDPPVDRAAERPPATPETMARLRDGGLGALALHWRGDGELARYLRDERPVPRLVRSDGEALANPAFLLGLANWALAANVRLGPWIHVGSEARHHGAVPPESALVVEARIVDLFSRGGHEFVDLDVAAFIEPDTPVLAARHRAIYRLREPS